MDWLNEIHLALAATDNARIALLLLVVLGVLYALAGHRLLRFMIGLTGFLLAAVSAGIGAGWLSQGNPWVMGGAALVGGICGAMALFFVYRAGVFALGGLGTAVVLHGALAGRPESWVPWAILGGSVLGGLLSLVIERPIMVLATAAIGGWMSTYAGAYLLLGDALPERLAEEATGPLVWAILGTWVSVTLLGASFQFLTGRRKRRDPGTVR